MLDSSGREPVGTEQDDYGIDNDNLVRLDAQGKTQLGNK